MQMKAVMENVKKTNSAIYRTHIQQEIRLNIKRKGTEISCLYNNWEGKLFYLAGRDFFVEN